MAYIARILAAAAVAAFGIGTASAQVEIKLPYETPPAHIKSRSIEVFKEALEKKSNGHFKVSLFPSAQLMPGKDEVPAVARGQVQMAIPALNYLTAIDPGFKLFEVPMLFDGYDAVEAAANGPVGKELMTRLASKRLTGAGFWYDGFTVLWTNAPVRKLEDLKGKKIRVFPSEILSKTTSALGAAPTAIPGAEVFLALKQGIADGAWTTAPYGAQIKLNEVLKGVTKLNLFVFGYVVVLNPAFMEAQPPAMRQAIMDSLAEGKAYNLREIKASIDAAYTSMAAAGMTVVDMDAAETARWRQALQPVYDGLEPDVKTLMTRVGK
ncbi:MAG: TRAP transporter substrate-binding protein [Rhodospirillales bacterium]